VRLFSHFQCERLAADSTGLRVLVFLPVAAPGTIRLLMSESPFRSTRFPGWPARLLLTVCAFLVFFGGLGSIPLLEPDEGRYAEIPREMLARGDFVTPHLNGVLYLEKPPLYYWLNAGAMAVLGRTELACRLASACLGLAGLGLAWALGRSMGAGGGRGTGLLATTFLGTAPLYVALARANIIDMTLSFFLGATLTCFWLAQEREKGERGERLLWYGLFASAALATLTKGLIGFVIPGAVIFFYLLLTRRWRLLLRVPWVGGIALFLAIAAPWHVLAAQRNPEFLWFYFVHEHLLRYTTSEAMREAPFWYFAPVLVLGLLPWSGLLPAAATLFRRGWLRERPELVFLAVWAGFVFLFFSASHSKLIPYVLPACLPLAVLFALSLERTGSIGRTRSWARRGLLVGAVVLALLALPFLWAALGRVARYSPETSPLLLAFALSTLAAALLAAVLGWRRGPEGRGLAALTLASSLFIGCIWAVGPRVGRYRSSKEIAGVLNARLRPGDEVYSFRCYPQSLPVYLDREIGVAHFRTELGWGIDHLPPAERLRRFPKTEELRDLWSSSKTLYLVLEKNDLDSLKTFGLEPGPILLEQDKLLLMTNRPLA
jgi:4-amino-4-deoxy-L-arabinose transferase-like glycosyltransferase